MSDQVKFVCSIGAFVLTKGPDNTYRGKANGVECSVRGLSVTISYGNRRDAFTLNNTLGSSLPVIGKRIESFCRELLYNDDRDVRYMETSRGRLAYYQYNTHLDTTPIIFVHGGPADGGNTKRAREYLFDHPLTVYDQMGCGRSDDIKDLGTWNHLTFAEELRDFVDSLGYDKVILVGESWGGGLATLYALMTGCAKVESLILISPFFGSEEWHAEEMQRVSLLSPGTRDLIERYNSGAIGRQPYLKALGDFYAHYFLVQDMYRDVAMAIADDDLSKVEVAMTGDKEFAVGGNFRDFSIVGKIPKITCRTLILVGDSDVLRVETAEKYRDAIKGSELAVIAKAGHLMSVEQPEQVRTAIGSFLARRPRSSGAHHY